MTDNNQSDLSSVKENSSEHSIKGQLTLRGIIIGCLGCAVITASSIYVALKMGALPWPIIFAAVLSLFLLKLVSRNTSTLNEANVTHTIMSSGAMVAGGLAFTIPAAWMLGLADEINIMQLIIVALCGSALGLLASILFRKHFIEEAKLEYPIGEAAAQTLKAGESGGKTGVKLFASMTFAGIYCFLRDGLHALPTMLLNLPIPGVTFGIYNSPMSLAVGFLIGTGAALVWFAGALLANFGIIVGFPAVGLTDTQTAQQIVSCLGMGCMMGCGVAVIIKDIIPKGWKMLRGFSSKLSQTYDDSQLLGLTANRAHNKIPAATSMHTDAKKSQRNTIFGIFIVAAIALVVCIVIGLPVQISIIVVLATFVACAMSAQSVGQTGIDPMEIFGLIVLLLVALLAQIPEAKLFLIAALVAVACGLSGDVMNDFKAGHTLGTSPKAQWIGQGIGAVIGSAIAVVAVWALLGAYGADSFGIGKEFVAAQASVVATMVSGIPNMGAFIIGLIIGFVLYLLRFPSMMLGLGIYLPFYMSFTAFLGAIAKLIYDQIAKRVTIKKYGSEDASSHIDKNDESGLIIASGLLGGESIIGIVLALIVTFTAF